MSKIIDLDDFTAYQPDLTLDDGLAQQIVDALNQYVENRTGRCFGETKQVTETYRLSNAIWLRHTDVKSIDSMSFGWPGQTSSPIVPSSYFFNPLGRITFFNTRTTTGSRFENDYISVTYTHGFTGLGYDDPPTNAVPTVPADLKLAALSLAAGLYQWSINHGRDVSQVSIGSYSIQYAQRHGGASTNPTEEAALSGNSGWAMIDSYKLKRV